MPCHPWRAGLRGADEMALADIYIAVFAAGLLAAAVVLWLVKRRWDAAAQLLSSGWIKLVIISITAIVASVSLSSSLASPGDKWV